MSDAVFQISDYASRRQHHFLSKRFVHRMDIATRRRVDAGILDDDSAIDMMRAAYAIEARGIERVGHVLRVSEDELRQQLGEAAFEILKADLTDHHLKLGMRTPGWRPTPLPSWLVKIL